MSIFSSPFHLSRLHAICSTIYKKDYRGNLICLSLFSFYELDERTAHPAEYDDIGISIHLIGAIELLELIY